MKLMASPSGFTGPVNIGNPIEFTMKELAELIISETGSSSPLVKEPLPQDDPKQRKPDISVAEARLGWQPKIPLREGLKPTIEYFRADLEK
jgi:UDP-glucuronate decarboxylase